MQEIIEQYLDCWNLAPAGAEPVVVGSDVALAGPDEKIVAVYGFLDQVPEA